MVVGHKTDTLVSKHDNRNEAFSLHRNRTVQFSNLPDSIVIGGNSVASGLFDIADY